MMKAMIERIASAIEAEGGRAYYAGGYVRDYLQKSEAVSKDLDIEVFGLDLENLQRVLARFGESRQVGKCFPVLKLKGYTDWDFTVPENPHVSLAEACLRRDFTINSMLMDVLTGEVIDLYGGQADLKEGVIRATHDRVFEDDPLRAYRAIQFVGRLGFRIAPATLQLIRQTELALIPPERVYEELRKLLLLSPHPSLGLIAMQETGILQQRHHLLQQLIGCEQSPINHPEGDVWVHTLMVVDAAAQLKTHSEDPEVYLFAALLHDLGKPTTTQLRDGKITTYGHDVEGAQLARDFMKEISNSNKLIEKIALLVREHMNPLLLYKQKERVGDKAIRKLLNRVNLKELLLLSEADYKGRDEVRDYEEIRNWFEKRLQDLGLTLDSRIEPLVQGRDLLELGMLPGLTFGEILEEALEMQMEGQSKERILQHIRDSIIDS